MPQPILYVAITNHGFGHATRIASVVAEVQHRCPDLLPILVTTAPRWLLEAYLPGHFILRPRALDVGVVQRDSLTMDMAATLERLQHIRARERAIIAAEANFIRQNRVSLVLADLPPLAVGIAHAAGVPCWMMSNFGWDFIYRDWGGEFGEMADWIASQFQHCDQLFRLPLHESMSAFPHVTDVGFTGGTPRYEPEELRQTLGLQVPRERTVLLTFGGLGLEQIPYECVQQFPEWQFITCDRTAPDDQPNLLKITDQLYRPVDLMPVCGRLISKPGYSTFSEACRLEIPVVSLTRDGFAEAPVLLTGLQHYLPHQIVAHQRFFDGDWNFLHQPLQRPNSAQPIPKDGNQTIAENVINFFQTAASEV